jgi:4-hydroxybenzoate polyprenyltransferase
MRSAGCVYNDLIDKEYDAKVKRTAVRPLASEELSPYQAKVFLVTLLLGGALILFMLPYPVILTGFIALILIFLYPWMKRITYWPQAFLGLTFNIGLIMGWLSLENTLSLIPLMFYAGAILWTLGYDTIYGFQDIQDDLMVGVKSSSIAVAQKPRIFLSVVYGGTLFLWGYAGALAKLHWIYWVFWIFIYLLLFWQVLTLRIDNPLNCLKRFESNIYIGLLLYLGIVFSYLID